MKATKFWRLAIRHPNILKPYRRILLVSHMRSNSSLIGHILGSHPEIEGYYELHMSYYTWRSFYRQKLLYFGSHPPKKGARFLFDKTLHSRHLVNFQLFERQFVLFSLREPRYTIPSMVRLYQRVDPDHELATVKGASDYYMKRVRYMELQSGEATGGYFYYDADALRKNPDHTLTVLGEYLSLRTPLRKEYRKQIFTGARGVGDTSESIGSGTILSSRDDYSDIVVPAATLSSLHLQYLKSRNNIMDSPNCRGAVTIDVSTR